MNTALLGEMTGNLLTFLTVWGSQTQGAATFVNGEGHKVFVRIQDLARVVMLFRIRRQSAFQAGIVGVDLHHGIGFFEIDLGEFIFLFQNYSSVEN